MNDPEKVEIRSNAENLTNSRRKNVAWIIWKYKKILEGGKRPGTAMAGKSGECAHYGERPAVCVEFDMGGAECLQMRAEFIELGVVRW